ncbi:hypothetical protein RJ640_009691 [Escallonia rubra]|uniref:Reverse transcriptase Ty1/copia-type domain-containing protein n=1 Tax=Escallonia rubra TaxID=112253 RepID=A0AA88SKU1_9ASTE|nr:hypothetical protein RJ640_009691 [Escallonia rubra]
MSMMGELTFFFGLQIKQSKDGIFINQAKYTKELLKRFDMEASNAFDTPMSSSLKLDKDEKVYAFQLMDEIWERAVETALDGQTDAASVRTLTLDGAVKCVHGRLLPPTLLEKFNNLQHLSKFILSDNRIAGGVEYLVEAGLESLRDLDFSNNWIRDINDLRLLVKLKLVSLDLYECPVTRVKDY